MPDFIGPVPDDFRPQRAIGSLTPGEIEWIQDGVSVRISFLDRRGNLPPRSGLNWGQRPDQNREPNQAYLSIKKDARREGYLPDKSFTFTMLTDDGESFDCVVAQEGRKAIHTTENNSILGKYIRKRIGVSEGDLINVEDLENYGRTDFTLEKIDDENFFFDFSLSRS